MQASMKLRQGKAHTIRLTPGGWLHGLAGTTEIAVNSLHNQGVDRLAPGLVVEGTAPDGTIEAVRVSHTPAGPAVGFAAGIQWHPEYDWPTDIVSRRIFESFAAAVRDYIGQSLPPVLRIAAE
jgi:putative glutamine amidotransferase